MDSLAMRFREILSRLSFNDWKILAIRDSVSHRYYLQVQVDGICNVTKEPCKWNGRKWFLSEYMTDSEVVHTALKAVLTAVEHEAREQFLYKGEPIFHGHFDVEALHEISKAGRISKREGEAH